MSGENVQHSLSTRYAATLQTKLHVFFGPFYRSLIVQLSRSCMTSYGIQYVVACTQTLFSCSFRRARERGARERKIIAVSKIQLVVY